MATLENKITHVLEETRVVLPGTQALLGFQFVVVFSEHFQQIPAWLMRVHIISLLFVILTTILLMTSASYHRIVEEGEDTIRFHKFASRMIVCAMAALTIGVCLDLLVILQSVFQFPILAVGVSTGMFLLFCLLWFVYPEYKKARQK